MAFFKWCRQNEIAKFNMSSSDTREKSLAEKRNYIVVFFLNARTLMIRKYWYWTTSWRLCECEPRIRKGNTIPGREVRQVQRPWGRKFPEIVEKLKRYFIWSREPYHEVICNHWKNTAFTQVETDNFEEFWREMVW